MKNLISTLRWILFIIITLNLMFIAFSAIFDQTLAAKGSNISISNNIHKSSGHTEAHNQIKGVKILRVHTIPSTVYVGEAFKIEGVVINNSTDTITFPNGTCNSPISLDFDKNVLTENKGIALCTTPTKDVILKPHQQSGILTTKNSGIVYKATSAGMTNATISFNYGVKTAAGGKPPVNVNISRVYTFNINNKGPTPTTTSPTTAHNHIRGIKVLHVQTTPSPVAIGDIFGIRALVINNSSSTITFSNGTCNRTVHINFNRNVIENHGNSCAATSMVVSLKPGEQSFVVSGVSYKAIAPGMTNATIVFNYQVQTANAKSTAASDNISRTYSFNIHKNITTRIATPLDTTHNHIKGIKVLHVHTIPSKVLVDNTFSLKSTVVNNSTATITFENGTCTSSLSVTFDKNVLIEHHPLNASCKAQLVTLKPAEQSPIVSPKSSDISYRAIAPGMTNATILFKYGPLTPISKSPISDYTTRTYSFNIQFTKTIPTTNAIASPIKIKP